MYTHTLTILSEQIFVDTATLSFSVKVEIFCGRCGTFIIKKCPGMSVFEPAQNHNCNVYNYPKMHRCVCVLHAKVLLALMRHIQLRSANTLICTPLILCPARQIVGKLIIHISVRLHLLPNYSYQSRHTLLLHCSAHCSFSAVIISEILRDIHLSTDSKPSSLQWTSWFLCSVHSYFLQCISLQYSEILMSVLQ
jgi:hypothetical protein